MSLRTMSLLVPMLALMAMAIAIAGCGGADEPELPGTTASSVLSYLEETDYQESWELWPGLGEKYTGQEPHGMLLTTYSKPGRL